MGLARRDLVTAAIVCMCLAMGLTGLTTFTCARDRESARRILCGNNLRRLASGMFRYSDVLEAGNYLSFPLGRGIAHDDFTGAEWLASLYWTDFVEEPSAFLCPASTDDNQGGTDLGRERAPVGRFGPGTVSYAGMHYGTLTCQDVPSRKILPRHTFTGQAPMACDDTEDPINHGTCSNGGMNIIFFDGHVEFQSSAQLDLQRAVGLNGGLLQDLRN